MNQRLIILENMINNETFGHCSTRPDIIKKIIDISKHLNLNNEFHVICLAIKIFNKYISLPDLPDIIVLQYTSIYIAVLMYESKIIDIIDDPEIKNQMIILLKKIISNVDRDLLSPTFAQLLEIMIEINDDDLNLGIIKDIFIKGISNRNFSCLSPSSMMAGILMSQGIWYDEFAIQLKKNITQAEEFSNMLIGEEIDVTHSREERKTLLHKISSGEYDNRFSIGDILGEGSYSDVFLAYDKTLGINVSLKTSKEYRPDVIIRELLCYTYLNSKIGIYRIYDCLLVDDMLILVSKIYKPIDVLFRKGYGKEIRKKVLFDIFMGLREINRLGYAHGDIKLGNLMFDPNNLDGVIIDFGLMTPMGITGRFYSREYIPPEFLRDNRDDMDFLDVENPIGTLTLYSDVWALGISICKLFGSIPDISYVTLKSNKLRALSEYSEKCIKNIGDKESKPLADLVTHMCEIDIENRWNIEQCLEHDYFK